MTCLARTSNTGDALPLAQEAGHRDPARGERAERGGGAHHGHRVPGVVHLRVPVLDRAGERVRPQARGLAQRLLAGQVPVVLQSTGGARGIGHGVVDRDAGADVGTLPDPVLQRIQERHRLHQVRGDAVEQQPALVQRLPDQPEVEHLQVPEPAVHQLARPARRAARPVAGFDDGRGQAARHRVERAARPDDATSHDQDIQLAFGHLRDRVFARRRGHCSYHDTSDISCHLPSRGCRYQLTSTQSRVRWTAFFQPA
jgi:hypothetical protein